MFKNNLFSVNNVRVISIYIVLISAFCAVLADSYILTTEDLEEYDNTVYNNKRSVEQNQNFLTRPRPGKREIYKVRFEDANEDIQRNMKELESSYYDKRSEINQNFLTRPRPGKREQTQNFLARPRPGKRERYYESDPVNSNNPNVNLNEFLRELEYYIIKDVLRNKLR